jgi:hypothetical protein
MTPSSVRLGHISDRHQALARSQVPGDQTAEPSAAFPEIYPLTVAGAHGRNEPAELAAPATLTRNGPRSLA